MRIATLLFGATLLWGLRSTAAAAPPALLGRGAQAQLIVDGKPFLILGGELASGQRVQLRGRGKQVLIEVVTTASAAE